MTPVVLGVDVGFASMGWARAELAAEGPRLLTAGVIRTAKGKASLLATEDNTQRARELLRGLWNAAARPGDVRAIAVESMSWPRNAGVTGKVGIAWGVLCAFAESRSLPIVHVSPQALKKALTGNRKASKDEVLTAVENSYGFSSLGLCLADVPRSEWEHPVDACAAILACMDTEIIRAIRSAAPSAVHTPRTA